MASALPRSMCPIVGKAVIEQDDIEARALGDAALTNDGRGTVATGTFRLGDWIVERDLNQLRFGDRIVHLSSLTMDILTYLARPPGRVVGAEELVRELWGGRVVSDNPVYKIIAKLRRALCDDAEQPRYIETVRKRGYRLVAPVSDAKSAVNGRAAESTKRRKTDLPSRMVAVMPVRAIGNHGGLECYCDGLTEELKFQLANVSDVYVVAPTTDKQDADLIVRPSVRMSATRIRITVRLIRAIDNVQLWAGAYERETGDGVESQISVAREVAHALQNAQ